MSDVLIDRETLDLLIRIALGWDELDAGPEYQLKEGERDVIRRAQAALKRPAS